MLAVIALIALVLLIGLVVRDGFKDVARAEEDVRRDRLVRAAERELRRLGEHQS